MPRSDSRGGYPRQACGGGRPPSASVSVVPALASRGYGGAAARPPLGVPPSQGRPRWCTTLLPVGRAPKERKGDFARGQLGAGMPRAGDEAPQRDGGCALRGPGYPGPASRVDGWAPVTSRLGTPDSTVNGRGRWVGPPRRPGVGPWRRARPPASVCPGSGSPRTGVAPGSISPWTSHANRSCNRRSTGGKKRDTHTRPRHPWRYRRCRGGRGAALASWSGGRPRRAADDRVEPSASELDGGG